jgi:hypothetical protein
MEPRIAQRKGRRRFWAPPVARVRGRFTLKCDLGLTLRSQEYARCKMVELFYRPNANTEDERTEYYGLVLTPLPDDTFSLIQLHIWWDEEHNQLQRSEMVLGFFDTEAENERIYQEQRSGLTRLGFTKVLEGHTHDTEPGVTYVHLPMPKREVPV